MVIMFPVLPIVATAFCPHTTASADTLTHQQEVDCLPSDRLVPGDPSVPRARDVPALPPRPLPSVVRPRLY
eukprot:1179236-Prorocentrum_minimum.AAC.1